MHPLEGVPWVNRGFNETQLNWLKQLRDEGNFNHFVSLFERMAVDRRHFTLANLVVKYHLEGKLVGKQVDSAILKSVDMSGLVLKGLKSEAPEFDRNFNKDEISILERLGRDQLVEFIARRTGDMRFIQYLKISVEFALKMKNVSED